MTLNRDGRKSTNASRVLGEWLREVVKITDPRFVFHSHRHSVKSILRNHPENPRVDLVDKILGHVGGKDDSGRDNGSSNAADGYGVFELRAMQRIIKLANFYNQVLVLKRIGHKPVTRLNSLDPLN